MRFVDQIWNGEGVAGQLARAALLPLEIVYRGAVALRGELYDRHVLETIPSTIPVISIGNLTVGGTGKTPIASWFADRIAHDGGKPAIVLRGYGGDEVMVHRTLTPDVNVIADTDRAAGIRRAAESGATAVVLDDAFQHRRASRQADIVVVSADAWTGRIRMLPAGPWREPLESIRRASIALISRRVASEQKADEVARAIAEVAPDLTQASIRLRMSECVAVADRSNRQDVGALSGKSVLAVSAIGDPVAFNSQLGRLGAIVAGVVYADHHAYTAADVDRIISQSRGNDLIVCTLKDAVKLGPLWPAGGPPLWYVSQSLDVEHGLAAIDEILSPFLVPK
ncbi:MAG: tetraacyldisaccharide 4'-kinase [Gemmatimonadaceae bacterium]